MKQSTPPVNPTTAMTTAARHTTAALLDRRPEARTFSVQDLLEVVASGRLRIPSFQRGLKWDRMDARLLLESLFRGYPVGTLLLWEAAAPAQVPPRQEPEQVPQPWVLPSCRSQSRPQMRPERQEHPVHVNGSYVQSPILCLCWGGERRIVQAHQELVNRHMIA